MKFAVIVRDVDHRSRQVYKTRDRALARFKEMVGYDVQNVIDEQYHEVPEVQRPTPETVQRLRGVSMFGTVVTFEAVE